MRWAARCVVHLRIAGSPATISRPAEALVTINIECYAIDIITNAANSVVVITTTSQRASASVQTYDRGQPAQSKVAAPLSGDGRRSRGAFITTMIRHIPTHGWATRQTRGCLNAHLNTMPQPLRPPLPQRMPRPEGNRQKRPRREIVCDELSML